MELRELQENWDEFGRRDPFWAVLTNPQFKDNRWDPAEFFATGHRDVRAVLNHLDVVGLRVARWRALDFGCAMGRLTQALCQEFYYSVGVDIAPSMIELANHYNNYPQRCFYILNAANHLRFLDTNSFDLVMTRIVLQHIRPPFNRQFVAELVRVADCGGAIVFQVPSRPAPIDKPQPDGRGPLPWTAYNAEVDAENLPANVKAGEPFEITVRVRNLSLTKWPSTGAANGCYFVQLGNHWLKENGEVLVADDGRAVLPHDLDGNEEVKVKLPLNAPSAPGTYLLELDMVEEGVTWFRNRGSKTFRAPVRVLPFPGGSRSRVNPVMEMHGIPREEVIEIVRAAGGKMAAIREDHSAGGWESFLYIATKA